MTSEYGPGELELFDLADRLTRAGAAIPVPTRGGQALARLMGEVESQRTNPVPAGLMAFLAAFAAGPVWRTALAAGAALFVVAGAGLGAAAATGNEPVRDLFGIASSTISVEFVGVVVDVKPGELRVDANGDLRIVTVDANTELTDGGDEVLFETIQPGMTVEIHGRLMADNTILATRVHIEDDAGVPTLAPTLTPEPTLAAPTAIAPGVIPTVHDDDEEDEDNQGPGTADDEDDDDDQRETDDNQGPGNADDDGDAEDDQDNSGPGSGDDDGQEGGQEGGHESSDTDDSGGDRSGSNSGPGSGGEDSEGEHGGDDGSSGSGGDND